MPESRLAAVGYTSSLGCAASTGTGARVEVITDRGVIRAGHAVVATHLPFLDRGGYFARAHPYRSYALSARLPHPAPTEMCISAEDPTRSCRPAPDGRIIVGGEGHKTGQEPDTRRCYRSLEAWANDTFGVEAIEHRWSAQDYQTVDGLPYIGRLTRRDDNVLIATGFRKWGMTNGTAAGYLLADSDPRPREPVGRGVRLHACGAEAVTRRVRA